MKKLFARRPSPALVVASVALIAALTGTAVALPGKNKVDSGDIKNNAVKGVDVAEGTLGTVPNATKLGGQSASSFAQSSQLAALAQDDQILSLAGSMDVGDPPLVLDVWGPFTFTGRCLQNMGVEGGFVDVSTSTDNAFLNAQAQDDADFDVADSPNELMGTAGNTTNHVQVLPDLDLWDASGEFGFLSASDGVPDGGQFGIVLNTPGGAECSFFGYAMGPDL